jgi:hypothetical protein
LLVLLLAFQAGAVALAASRASTTSCCRRLKASCCCKDKQGDSGPAWKAAQDCQRRCAAPAIQVSQHMGTGALESGDQPTTRTEAVSLPEAAGHDSSYLAFLYQRPPPVR